MCTCNIGYNICFFQFLQKYLKDRSGRITAGDQTLEATKAVKTTSDHVNWLRMQNGVPEENEDNQKNKIGRI
jgi:hypothetical protein